MQKTNKYTALILFLICSIWTKADVILSEDFSVNSIPAGWANTAHQGTAKWSVRNAPVFSSLSGGSYAVFDDFSLGSTTFPNEASLASPEINCSGRTALKLKFSTYFSAVEGSHGFVEVSGNGGATWIIVRDFTGNSTGTLSSPSNENIDVSLYISSQFRFRFRYSDGNAFGKYWYIDDITVSAENDASITGLIFPQSLTCGLNESYNTSESVTVRIQNSGSAPISNFSVKCDISGNATYQLSGIFSGTLAANASTDYTFSQQVNLLQQGTYLFKIFTELPNDNYHANDTIYETRTQAINIFPFTENFSFSNNWKTGSSAGPTSIRKFEHGNIPYLGGPESFGNSWFINVSSTTTSYEEIWLESPVFNFSEVTKPTLSVDIKYQLHDLNYVNIQYSTNGGSTWNVIGTNLDSAWYNNSGNNSYYWSNNQNNPVANWTKKSINLCKLSGEPCVVFRIIARPLFGNTAPLPAYYFAIDNFSIGESTGDDLKPLAFILPKAGQCSPVFSTTEQTALVIENKTCRPLTNIPVLLSQTGAANASFNDTISGPVLPNSRHIHFFGNSLNLNAAGSHNLSVEIDYTTDIDSSNNSLTETRFNSKVNSFPYLADFNSDNMGWRAGLNLTTNPNNRLFVNQEIPYLNGPEGNGKSWSIEVSENNNLNMEIWVESPVFDFSAISGAMFSMDIKCQLHDRNFCFVEYSTNGGSSWQTLGTSNSPNWYNITGTGNSYWRDNISQPINTWKKVSHSLCELAGKPCVKFRVKAVAFYNIIDNSGGYYYFAFDNVSIIPLQKDVAATSIISPVQQGCLYSSTQNITAAIKNMGCTSVTDIPVKCKISGPVNLIISDTLTGQTLQPGSIVNFPFTQSINLTSPGIYNIAVYTDSPEDINKINDTSFITINVPTIRISTFPYTVSFNSGQDFWYSGSSDTSNHRWFEYGSPPYLNGAGTNQNSWFVNTDIVNNISEFVWVESPVFDFSSVQEAILSFEIKYQLSGSNNAWVEYSTDGGQQWSVLGTTSDANWYNAFINNTFSWGNNYNTPIATWTVKSHSLCKLAGEPCVKFRINARTFSNASSGANGDYFFAFDNFSIIETTDVSVDLSVMSFSSPDNDICNIGSDQQIKINTVNPGCSGIANYLLVCEIAGPLDTIIQGISTNLFPAGTSSSFTFPGNYTFSDTGTYFLKAYTSIPNDINHNNDTAFLQLNISDKMISSFPYFEDFSGGIGYWKSKTIVPGATDRKFIVGDLPYLNGSQGNGNSVYLHSNSVTSANNEVLVESPVFNLSSTSNPVLSFEIKHQLLEPNIISVQYTTNGGTSWETLGTETENNWYNYFNSGQYGWGQSYNNAINIWKSVRYKLCFLEEEACVKFRIYAKISSGGTGTNGGHYYFAFDNFKIESTPVENDVFPVSIICPNAGMCGPFYNSTDSVIIILKNNSCGDISGLPVTFVKSGPISETINTTIPGNIIKNKYYQFFVTTSSFQPAGNYTLSLETELSNDVDTSNNVVSETRLSGKINSFPYSETFAAGNSNWMFGSSSKNNPVNRLFLLDSLPYLNGSEGHYKSWFVECSDASTSNEIIWVESPVFDFTNAKSPMLSLDIKSKLNNVNSAWAEFSTNGGNTWEILGSASDTLWYTNVQSGIDSWGNNAMNPDTTWKKVQHSLCNLSEKPCVKFRIIAKPYSKYSSVGSTLQESYYFAFDNFQIIENRDIEIASIISPSNSQCSYSNNEKIILRIRNNGCTKEFNFPLTINISGAVNISSSFVLTDTILPASSIDILCPVSINMSDTGEYYLQVFSNIPGDINTDNDTIEKVINVTTKRISTFPYLENFNSGSGYWAIGGNTTGVPHRWFELGALPYLNGPEGQGNSWYIKTDAVLSENKEIWIESPVFDFSEITNPSLSFDLKYQMGSQNYAWIQYSTDGGLQWYTLGTNTEPQWYNMTGANNDYWGNNYGNPVSEWTTLDHNLCNLAGQSCVKFRIRARPYSSQTGSYYFAIDNFSIYNSNIDAQILEAHSCYGSNTRLAVRLRNNSEEFSCGNAIYTSSSSYNTTSAAAKAFDSDKITSGWGSASSLPCWVECNYSGNPVAINSYSITCSGQQTGSWAAESYNPKTWCFQAFNGFSWITLDSIGNGLIQKNTTKTFSVSNSVQYEKYRIFIYATEGASRTHITELELSPQPAFNKNINYAEIGYKINETYYSVQFNNLLLEPGKDTTLYIDNVLIPDESTTLKIWVSNPNSTTDYRTYNDTIYPNLAFWPNCNIHCANATELLNSVTITSCTYNLPDHEIYNGSIEDYDFNQCADPDTFTVDQSVWYYFHTSCEGGNVNVTFQSVNNSAIGIQAAIFHIPHDSVACNPAYYNNIFCSTSDALSSTINFSGTLPTNSLFYIMVDASGNMVTNYKILLSGNVDTLGSVLGTDTAICRGDSALLHSNLNGSYKWWLSGDTTNILSTQSQIIVSPQNETTYCIEVTSTTGCVDTDSVKVKVNHQYNATIDTVPVICSDVPLVLLSSFDTVGTWHGPGITDTSISVFYPSVSGIGSFLIYHKIDDQCGDIDSTEIIVLQKYFPQISIPDSVCLNDSIIVLQSNVTGGFWSGQGITDSIAGKFNTYISGIGAFEIIYQIPGECSNSDTAGITINQIHNANINAAPSLCSEDSAIVLTAFEPGGIWTGSGIINNQVGIFSPVVAGQGNHLITYKISDICSATDSIVIEVLHQPNAEITSFGPYCILSNNETLVAVDQGGIWSGAGITNPINGTFNPSAAGQGNHTIIYKFTGQCNDADTVVVSVVPQKTAIIHSVADFCSEDIAVNLTADSAGGLWSGAGITNSSLGVFNPSIAGPGSHMIHYTISGLCGNSDSIVIIVGQQKHADILSTGPFCVSDTSVYLSSADTGGIWSGNGIYNATTGNFSPAQAGVGFHQIIYSIAGFCGDSDTTVYEVKPQITVNISPVDTLCSQDSPIALTTNFTGGSWSGTGITDTTIGTFDPVASGEGFYYIKYTVYGVCGDSDSTLISVLHQANANINTPATKCLNSPAFSINSAEPGGSWVGTGITDSISGVFSPILAGVGSHNLIYNIYGTCGDSDTASIVVLPIPNATVSNDTSICRGSAVIISASGGSSYHWSNGYNISSINVSPVNTTNYFVTVTNAGCSVKDSVLVTVLSIPPAVASVQGKLCEGNIVTLTSDGGSSYQWSGPSGFFSINQSPSLNLTSQAISGIYSVKVTGQNGCTKTVQVPVSIGKEYSFEKTENVCSGNGYVLPGGSTVYSSGIYTDSLFTNSGCDSVIITNLTINPISEVTLLPDKNSAFAGEYVMLIASGTSSFVWDKGNTGPQYQFTENSPGLYDVCVTGKNQYNCTDTACVRILVRPLQCNDGELFIPNAFSPNNDGANDELCLYATSCIEKMDFRIFDRWGKVIFESYQTDKCWDGKLNGTELNTGVYIYYFSAQLKSGSEILLKGNISLVR